MKIFNGKKAPTAIPRSCLAPWRWLYAWLAAATTVLGARGMASASGRAMRADPQTRLLAAQQLFAEALGSCALHMSGRDRQLYRRLTHTPSLDMLVAMRFEGFDLMCRCIGEGAARAWQRCIDTWLVGGGQPVKTRERCPGVRASVGATIGEVGSGACAGATPSGRK